MQLKSKILEGSLSCEKDTAVLLASYSAQGENISQIPGDWVNTCVVLHVFTCIYIIPMYCSCNLPCTLIHLHHATNLNFFPLLKNIFIKLIINRWPEKHHIIFSPLKCSLCLAELGDYEAEKFSGYIEDQSLFPCVSFQV